jgi:RNA polymerase sigma-70 factor (ECF subfamily)
VNSDSHANFGGTSRTDSELLEGVYDELRRLAASYLRRERKDHTLQATALVHEAYLRIASTDDQIDWNTREQLIAVAATMMRRILVNHAIKRNRNKRGGGYLKLSLSDLDNVGASAPVVNLLELNEALIRMEAEHPFESRVVELKYFGGLSIAETAAALEISDTTVERSWRFARAWLLRELTSDD